MQITVLRAKIHKAIVTESNLHYEGSITIDEYLLKKSGIYPYEKVLVTNISRGTRFETYIIAGKSNSGTICLNGAAARLGKKSDIITIMAFTEKAAKEVIKHKPKVILLNKKNKIIKTS